MNKTKESKNNTKIIKSFFLDSSTDFATKEVISLLTFSLRTTLGVLATCFGFIILSFLSFLGLPGHALILVFGFLETNSFFGLPGAFFFCFTIL